MKTKKLLSVFFALNLFLGASSAQAANLIWLQPESTWPPAPGSIITFTLHMDFTDTTLGGGLDVFYDSSILSFVSFVFNTDFVCDEGCPSDPLLSREGDDLPGEVNGIGFASFFGITGYHKIGVLTFHSTAFGSYGIPITMADNDSPAGYFVDYPSGAKLPVDYLVTPLPAAAWLMLAGLGLLIGVGRRKR